MKVVRRYTPFLAMAFLTAVTPHAVLARPAAASFLPQGMSAEPPTGFADMCRRDLVLCAAGGHTLVAADLERLTPQLAAMVPEGGVAANAGAVAINTAGSTGTGTAATARGWFGSGAPITIGVDSPTAVTPIMNNDAWQDNQARRLLRRINGSVNHHVIQLSDFTTTGVAEYWRRPLPGPTSAGDCEDIAIEKRMQLLAAGFPAERMFFGVVYRTGLGLHTVLVARLDKGDVVLDSATQRMQGWQQSGYVWLRQQSPTNPLLWQSVPTEAVRSTKDDSASGTVESTLPV